MSLETDAFESIKLSEESPYEAEKQLFFHSFDLDSDKQIIRPKPLWMLAGIFIHIAGALISSLILYRLLMQVLSEYDILSFMQNYIGQIAISSTALNKLLLFLLISIFVYRFFFLKVFRDSYALFLLLNTEYEVTRYYIYLRVRLGARRGRLIPVSMISSIYERQNIVQRLFKVGDIILKLKGGSNVFLHSIDNFYELSIKIIKILNENQEAKQR